jgi:23S rRNA-/tRNA-specific pseudouridylate synthase
MPAPFDILFSSDDELIINKRAGLPSEPTRDPDRPSALGAVQREHPDAKLPHRLDAFTSGALVIALTADAIRWHNRQLQQHAWRKLYVARLPSSGPSDRRLLGEHLVHLKRVGRRAEVVRAGGRRARLTVRAIARDPTNRRARQALVELHTGRFHQIRVTFAHLGSPLVGDGLYGGPAGESVLHHVRLTLTPAGRQQSIDVSAPHEAIEPGLLELAEDASPIDGGSVAVASD